MMKRLAFVLPTCFCLVLVSASASFVSAKDTWTSVRSKNFQLVGNASEKDIRQVGVQLEQFREVFSRLFPTLNVNSPIPTTVIVFRNNESYRPFKPSANSAGYFQSGPDVNYIALKLGQELPSERDPFNIIFHEYTHLLVQNTSGNVPTWLSEGLAEYYSTLSVRGDQKVVMGSKIASHVDRLRDYRMLPLRALFQVDHKSPYYNERDKQGIFYAESWALIHYLILGNDGQRMPQLGKFLELLSAGVAMEPAFQQAFVMSFESMEQELRAYVERDHYPVIRRSFNGKVGYDTTMWTAPLSEAEAQAYLGDLLLHSNRMECESYLQRALALDPHLAMANASLGMLRLRQGKPDEARKSLERAVAASDQNYLVHYYYAYALSREGNLDMQAVMGFAPETAASMRAELKRAIELRPDFPESYSLLAFVNLVTNTELAETLDLLKRAVAGSPGRNDLVFMLAQLYLRQQDCQAARQLIDKLASSSEDELQQRAKWLLAKVVSLEEQLALSRAAKAERAADSPNIPELRDARDATGQAALVREIDLESLLRDSLKKPAAGERQAQGTLARIDCDARGITFVLRTNERLLKLGTDSFRQVGLKSFSQDAGREVTCGPRTPENNVVVSYQPATDARLRVDGVIRSVEFVPPDFKLKP